MKTPRAIPVPPLLAALALLVPSARAQWSSDPAVNSTVSAASGEEVQAKLRPTADGGVLVSWFGGAGYDVRVQRLGANGTEVFAAGGVLVADRGFSSTQDYGLDVGADGSALLAFRDDRFTGVQVTAARIGPDGAAAWGANGVQLTSTGDFVAAPTIAATADGGAVVAWTQNETVHVQRLDASGVKQWVSDVVLVPPAGGSFSASDLQGSGNDAILSYVHQVRGFGSQRVLVAQKFLSSGATLWGPSGVALFGTGSLQFGNFPDFVSDGGGGAVFSWYDAGSSQLQCYVQHVLANGATGFGPGPVAVSTNATRVRVSPQAAYDPNTGETTVVWREQSSNQAMDGVYAQRLDGSGARLWGSEGSAVVALGATSLPSAHLVLTAAGTLVFWESEPAFGQDTLVGARLDAGGAVDVSPFDVASTPSGKSRVAALRSSVGTAILAWSDDRSGPFDLLAQNVNSDGTLGLVGTLSCFGNACPCGNDDAAAGCFNSTGRGAFLAGVGSLTVAVDDLALATTQLPPFANGILFMGSALVGPLPFGDGLRCVAGSTFRWGFANSGAAGTFTYGPGLSAFSSANFPVQFQLTAGSTWNFQTWYRDPGGPCGSGFSMSNAESVTFVP